MYLELNEIFNDSPSTLSVDTSSLTVPISGEVDDNSTLSTSVDNLMTLLPPSRANSDARSIA